MMTTRVLCRADELADFAREYSRLTGHAPRPAYLARCLARGFFVDGRLCGGYLLNTQPPFRYLEVIGGDARPALPVPAEDLCECCCFWRSPAVSRATASLMYAYIGLDLFRSGRRYLLGGSLEPRLARLQKRGLPHTLYRGRVVLQGRQRVAEIYYGSRATFARAFAAGLVQRLAREAWGQVRALVPTGHAAAA